MSEMPRYCKAYDVSSGICNSQQMAVDALEKGELTGKKRRLTVIQANQAPSFMDLGGLCRGSEIPAGEDYVGQRQKASCNFYQ